MGHCEWVYILFGIVPLIAYKFTANDDEDEHNLTSYTFQSKKRKNSVVDTGQESHKRLQPVLHSAFHPPSNDAESDPVIIWSRNPPMVLYSFTQKIAQYNKGKVTFLKEHESSEKIGIASDWLVGQKLIGEKKAYWTTGFIGEGFTKTGVYVSRSVLSQVHRHCDAHYLGTHW
jgi:hypothetical protein